MKTINFIMANMCYLPHFMPLIIEANKMGIHSKMFCFYNGEKIDRNATHNQHPGSHIEFLKGISKQYGFDFIACKNDNDINGVVFFGERRGINNFNKKVKRVVLTANLDFIGNNMYDWYVGKVDHVVMVSKFLADMYHKTDKKNLYLGSTKYDLTYNRRDVLKKYGVEDKKTVLLFAPNHEDGTNQSIALSRYCSEIKNAGFQLIIKTRSRSKYEDLRKNADIFVNDDIWFPLPSLELLSISNAAVLFNTSANKECTMLNVPFINFDVVHNDRPFRFLFSERFCRELPARNEGGVLVAAINDLIGSDLSKDFKNARQKYFFEPNNTSRKILEAVL